MDAPNQPDDIAQLKALIAQQQTQLIQQQTQLDQKQHRIDILEEYLRQQRRERFGPTSEAAAGQGELFDEAEHDYEAVPMAPDTVELTSKQPRKKPGRRPLPKDLPRVDIVHDLPEDKKHCDCGTPLISIGDEISEQLDVVPMTIQVLRHIRKQYVCSCCEGKLTTAPLPAQPIPKSNASAGLLAHVAVSKYADALPLYRQVNILQRYDAQIDRTTLANWMINVGQLIQPLINLLNDDLLASGYIHCDETTTQVLHEPGKTPQSQSYMWVRVTDDASRRIVLYDYDPSRSAEVPKRLLADYQGYLHTDGYSAYDALNNNGDITHIGCWAHVRRYFIKAEQGQPKPKKQTSKITRTKMALHFISRLYGIEQRIKELPVDEKTRQRQQHSVPILEEFKGWLDKTKDKVPPKTLLGKALGYLDGQWGKLVVYPTDGRLSMDNNIAENAIRPFVIGRKNWLFANSQRGAKASANLYSLIETAKANDVEPYAYLKQVFTELPQAYTVEQIETLLPWKVDLSRV